MKPTCHSIPGLDPAAVPRHALSPVFQPMALLSCVAALAFGCVTQARGGQTVSPAPRAEVEVGGRKIQLPAPPEFGRVDGLDAEKDSLMESMLPATNRYLARFDPLEGDSADKGRSFNAQVLRSLEYNDIGDRTFRDVKQELKMELDKAQDQIRKEIAKISNRTEKTLQDATDTDAAFSVGNVAILGYFDDSSSCLGFTMAMNVTVKVSEQEEKHKVVAAAMIVPVNGRLVSLYANADYASEDDRKWVERAVTAWRDQVVSANPRMDGPPGKTRLVDVLKRSGFVGGIAGALAGAVGALVVVSKMRRKKA